MSFVLEIMRMSSPLSLSRAMALRLIAVAAIAIILFAANVTITNAHPQQQQQQLLQLLLQLLTSQPATVENGTTIFQSTKDSFRIQVPEGGVIQDVNNTDFTLVAEILQGYGILAQLCPEEQQAVAVIGDNNNTFSRCERSEGNIIHIIRYPNLGARLGFASDEGIATTNNNGIATDTILAYQMQKLQEVGYRDIRIVNSTDTTVNVISTGLNNNVIAIMPAKLVEMTYSTASAPNETRKGYFLSTATDATPRNLGMITGYGIFSEGNSTTAETTTASSRLSPVPVMQVFDSFDLIAGKEVEQAILAALRALVAQAEEPKQAKEKEPSPAAEEETEETTCDSSYPDLCIPPPPPDLNCDDISTRNFEVLPPDPHGFDGNDNDGIGCEIRSNQPDLDDPDNNSGPDNLLDLYDSGLA
jgi:hypothetical protein